MTGTKGLRLAEAVLYLVLRVDTQRVENCRGQVLRRVRVGSGIGREAIRSAQDTPARGGSSAYDHRIAMRPVIPAGLIDAVARELTEAGCPAKLAHADHQSSCQ